MACETPSRSSARRINWAWASGVQTTFRGERLETAAGTDLLRVMISKSLNFISGSRSAPASPSPRSGRDLTEALAYDPALSGFSSYVALA